MTKALTGRATRGVGWSAIAQATDRFSRLVSTTVLAAILIPADFGLVGVVASIGAFINIFRNAGTGAAVVQRENLTKGIVDSVFCYNVVAGFIAAVFGFLVANPVAAFFDEPMFAPIIQLTSVAFFLSSLAIVPTSLMSRRMEFKKLALIEGAGSVFFCVVAIIMAVNGWGVWSLVVPGVARSAIFTVVRMIAANYYGSFQFRWAEFKSIFRFSGFLTAFEIVKYMSNNLDIILVAKILGMQAAGYYGLAYGLLLMPLQGCVDVIRKVMFPAFSLIQNDEARFRSAYLRAVSILAFLVFPVIIGEVAVVHDVVILVYGTKWEIAAIIFMILAPIGLMESIASTVVVIYQAKARTDLLFGWTAFSTAVIIPAMYLGLSYGVTGLAAAYSIANIVLIIPCLYIPLKLISLPLMSLVRAIFPSLVCAICMGVTTVGCGYALQVDHTFEKLIAKILVGIVSYAAFSMYINRSTVREFQLLLQAARPANDSSVQTEAVL